jgi:replicative DNA helicase
MSKKKIVIKTEMDEMHQHKVERIVLGSILISREAIYDAGGDFQLKLFSDERNILIADAILKLHIENTPIDLITLVEKLRKEQNLENSGGLLYISDLTASVSSTANLEYHLRMLQQYWLTRYINECCSEAQFDLIEYKKDIFDVYSELQLKLDNATKDLVHKDLVPLGVIHTETMANAYESIGKGSSGVPSGINRLDNLTNGFQKSDLIILAGRTSMGKTAFSISILIEPVIHQKIPVAFFSLEMSKEQVVGRVQSILSKINVSKIVKKQLDFDEINLIIQRCSAMKDAPLFIDDTPNISLMELKTKARKMVRENGVKMIVVDYLQLMRSGVKTISREQEVAEISKGLKAIAKELNVPVIALSQLSRNVEQRGGSKVPMLSDLRDSGQIEQDADMVLFCYRPEYYGISEYDWGGTILDTHQLFMLFVSKHRNGVLGELPLTFYGEFTQVTNHSLNSALYSDTTYSSNAIPESIKNSGNKTLISSENSRTMLPNMSNFENENSSTRIPDNKRTLLDEVKLPYKDDLTIDTDETPF